ncbi:hypothetical protein [Stratiformator vulcanicus]|nr:hypothetical protein [Stratiformator vulcanicus]
MSDRLVTAFATIAIVLPVLHVFHMLDAWPAWAVYSPAVGRVSFSVAGKSPEDELPQSAWRSLRSLGIRFNPEDTKVITFNLNVWCEEELGVPTYSGGRFVLGLIAALTDRYGSVDFDLRGRADRYTGKREVLARHYPWGLDYAHSLYRLNSRPRESQVLTWK